MTGQVGLDKGPYLEALKAESLRRGLDVEVFHVGQMMYAEAPDVPKGRILNLPITRLNALRRSVFKEIMRVADQHEHVIINSHATFRWHHGLFSAVDFDQIMPQLIYAIIKRENGEVIYTPQQIADGIALAW